jgi:hypothetical protein
MPVPVLAPSSNPRIGGPRLRDDAIQRLVPALGTFQYRMARIIARSDWGQRAAKLGSSRITKLGCIIGRAGLSCIEPNQLAASIVGPSRTNPPTGLLRRKSEAWPNL